MTKETLLKRISRELTNNRGQLKSEFIDVVRFLKNPKQTIRPTHWFKDGRHFILIDDFADYVNALTLLGVDFEAGNDAPRGGQEGNFVRLTKKGLRQVADFSK